MPQRSLHVGRRSTFLLGLAVSISLLANQTAVAAETGMHDSGCPAMEISDWGVLDYRTADPRQLHTVEKYHFTPEYEQLKSSKSAGNISYTLRRFQNHHRAMMAMVKLSLREKRPQPIGAQYSVDCYLTRAESIFPDDGMIKMIHGFYLIRSGRPEQGVEILEAARMLDQNNANLHYNLGLAYLELKRYNSAVESAHRAYSLGFPLPGLRDRLQRAGKWKSMPMK